MDNDTGKLSLHPEMAYQSSQYFEVINVPRLQQSGYAILGAHLDFETADGRWTASIWGKNLTNNRDVLYGFNFADILVTSGFVPARTYGLDVIVKFNP